MRLADGGALRPAIAVRVPGATRPRYVHCRGICFLVSNTAATQGLCGSFVDRAVALRAGPCQVLVAIV